MGLIFIRAPEEFVATEETAALCCSNADDSNIPTTNGTTLSVTHPSSGVLHRFTVLLESTIFI